MQPIWEDSDKTRDMKSIAYNNDSWLFANQPMQTHDITYDDIQYLLDYAEKEDRELRERQKMVADGRVNKISDYVLQELFIRSVQKTIIQYPFGDRIITFGNKMNLFRGENQDFLHSLPSLRRKEIGKSKYEKELWRTIANMRIWQFYKLILRINVVPYWMAKVSDVNRKVIAQHYGFDTYLLDLTNDFSVALFFACCKYVPEHDCYRPLNDSEVRSNHKYGIIYHSPRWILDYMQRIEQYNANKISKKVIDSGEFDETAFQIGY